MADDKEYIERGALIARFKASPLFQNFGEDGRFILTGVVELLETLPATDAVEVVRCRKCVHYRSVDTDSERWCEILKAESPIEDGFCCYGERTDIQNESLQM